MPLRVEQFCVFPRQCVINLSSIRSINHYLSTKRHNVIHQFLISHLDDLLELFAMSGKVILDLEQSQFSKGPKARLRISFFVLALFAFLATNLLFYHSNSYSQQDVPVPRHLARAKARCAQLKLAPGPPPDFTLTRTVSDRFVLGTSATLIKNATLWTGRVGGLEIIHGDVLLDKGLIKGVGRVNLDGMQVDEVVEVDANGAWVTSG